jgi:hypothetical protein
LSLIAVAGPKPPAWYAAPWQALQSVFARTGMCGGASGVFFVGDTPDIDMGM